MTQSKSNVTLSDSIAYFPIEEGSLDVEEVREAVKELKEKQKMILVFIDALDDYFPKGDKRRGEVLALLGNLHIEQEKVIDEVFGGKLI